MPVCERVERAQGTRPIRRRADTRYNPTIMRAVEIHSPGGALEFSDAALAHLRDRLENSEAPGLRLGLIESGCSGYMYELEYLDGAIDEAVDTRVNEAVPIFVAKSQLPLVQGTRVDYVTEGLNATLRFENPRASASCGCGESFSFSLDQDESQSSKEG